MLQLESIFFFLVAVLFYNQVSGNWLLFVLLLLVPDISMVGYLKNPKTGALLYNLVHNYILALTLAIIGFTLLQNNFLTQIGIILFAHVSMDRALGFGLKEPTNFKHTHLGKIGK